MNFFGIHFCQDELYAILLTFDILPGALSWCKARYWAWRKWKANRRARLFSNRKDP